LLAMVAFLGSISTNIYSQTRTLKPALQLKIDRTGGANGANVAWHPAQKKYYAAMAGNAVYPMAIFDKDGKKAIDDEVQAMTDVRGLWYNPVMKALQCNGYDKFGWSEYRMDEKGKPTSARSLSIATSQPDAQSVGAYDPKNNLLYFIDVHTNTVESHSLTNGAPGPSVRIHPEVDKNDTFGDAKENELPLSYNENAIIFTGIKKAEIGLLNVAKKRIELYDLSSGKMTQTLELPSDAPSLEYSLNFSYCNGIYWLFSKAERIWFGYK
jgi:hypothetical protein